MVQQRNILILGGGHVSLALGKPQIATSSMPGQEKDNLRFIQQRGLGWVALESKQLRALIDALASDFSSERSMLNSMRVTVQSYQRVNAAANESLVSRIRALFDRADRSAIICPASSMQAAAW